MTRPNTDKAKPKSENGFDWQAEMQGVSTPADVPMLSFPTLQWLSGLPGLAGTWREQGHFFIDAEQGVKTDWEHKDLITKKGETVSGNAVSAILATVIRMRRAWFVYNESTGENSRFPWNAYKQAENFGSPRGKMQIIMHVSGLAGYVALTLRGNLSRHAIERGGWGERARKYLYDPASYIMHAGKPGIVERLPSLCFRVGLAGERLENGKARYLTVGEGDKTSVITPIALIDPTDTVTDFAPYVVPMVLRKEHETMYASAKTWVDAWDTTRDDAMPEYAGPETDIS